MTRFPTLMIITALTLGTQTAYAASPLDVPSKAVRFADLDLSRYVDASILYRRLQGAAGSVCAPLDGLDLFSHRLFKTCMTDAVAAAVERIGRPALTRYHEDQLTEYSSSVRVARK